MGIVLQGMEVTKYIFEIRVTQSSKLRTMWKGGDKNRLKYHTDIVFYLAFKIAKFDLDFSLYKALMLGHVGREIPAAKGPKKLLSFHQAYFEISRK